jgi:hypothetical protein
VVGVSKLIEFESCLREASSLLKDAEVVINAMVITGDYRYLQDVENLIRRALDKIGEARRIGRGLVEEVDRALPVELEDEG